MKAIPWIIGIYAGYCLLMFALQRQMIYPRYAIDPSAPAATRTPGLEKTWVATGFGNSECWYLPPAGGDAGVPSPAVIFAHGNAERIDDWPDELLAFTRLGIGVLLVEYPGYGRSSGSPSQASVTGTFAAAYDLLAARPDVDPSRVVLFGRSLGGGAVCALARKRPAAALILMSTFTSIRSFAPRYLVPGRLIRDPYDNLSAVAAFDGPVLVIHGRADEVILFHHGEALAGAARDGRLLAWPCGHADLPPGWFGFADAVEGFLKDAGILPVRPIPSNGPEWRAAR